jgi:hypothetical protein
MRILLGVFDARTQSRSPGHFIPFFELWKSPHTLSYMYDYNNGQATHRAMCISCTDLTEQTQSIIAYVDADQRSKAWCAFHGF